MPAVLSWDIGYSLQTFKQPEEIKPMLFKSDSGYTQNLIVYIVIFE